MPPARVADLRAGFDEAAAALGSVLDAEQRPAAERLALLGHAVVRPPARRPRWSRGAAPRGVYLHGPVGRGKTWLVDALLDQLPGDGVLRLHAYESARLLHRQVARQAGSPGAVDRALADVLRDVRLLFLDELHAHDPGDAMLLSRLVGALLRGGAALVATSNYAPRGLLPHPLHHHLVLPLVGLLEQHCDVLVVDGPRDHRTAGHGGARPAWSSGAWLQPGSEAQVARLGLHAPAVGSGVRLLVGGRDLQARSATAGAVWCTFAALCDGRTSTSDFLELTERFRTVVVEAVPDLGAASEDARRRFADLVDVLWDRDVRLVVLSSAGLDRLDQVPVRDGERLRSRLALLRRR